MNYGYLKDIIDIEEDPCTLVQDMAYFGTMINVLEARSTDHNKFIVDVNKNEDQSHAI